MASENRLHTLFKSPAVYVGDFCCRPRDGACGREEHSLGDDLAFVRRGMFVKHVGRRQFVVNPNHVVFFNRAEGYRVGHPVGGGDDCTVFALRRDVLLSVLESFRPDAGDRPGPLFPSVEAPSPPDLHLRHLQLWRAIRDGTMTDVGVEESVLELVAAAVAPTAKGSKAERRAAREATRRAHRESVEGLKSELARRTRDRLRLDELARAVHLSPYHLCRVFRRQTGQSIHAYRTQLRLRESLSRLAEGAADLTRLALELGFTDHSHFSNAFRRAFGVSPSRFRGGLTRGRMREMSTILQA